MTTWAGGVRLGGLRGVGVGSLILARSALSAAEVSAGVIRSAAFKLGKAARRSVGGVAPGVGLAMRAAKRLRETAARCATAGVVWHFGARAGGVGSVSSCWPGGRVVISPGARRVGVSVWSMADGPGASSGESVYVLPDAWAGWPLPAGYIGEALLLAALARGDAWALVGGGVAVGGRVLVDQYGAPLALDADDVGKWLGRQLLTIEKMLGAVWMADGAARDEALSSLRSASWADVRKRAKSINGIQDAAVRAALVADLDFLMRAV